MIDLAELARHAYADETDTGKVLLCRHIVPVETAVLDLGEEQLWRITRARLRLEEGE
jgi:hypothetical protein